MTASPAPGRLVAIEGIDGCGKSTQARLLAAVLGAELTHEPGGTPMGVAIRRLVLDAGLPPPVPRAEVLLMAADRAQHVDEVIGPELAAGNWVVTDRFSGSTLAYQGLGRGLALPEVRAVVTWAEGGVAADLSVLVDVPTEVARRRLERHAPDRLERLDAAFHDRVRRGYLALAKAEPGRWAVVDGTRGVDQVAADVVAAVEQRLGRPGTGGSSGPAASGGGTA